MKKILTTEEAHTTLVLLRKSKKRIVLAGGCFDILHKGHIQYLSKAREAGDVLVVLLESDESIQSLKGKNRPIHSQQDRAHILSHLSPVDIVIPLSGKLSDSDYDELIFSLKPDIIATTKGDPSKRHKIRQAERVNANVIDVVDHIKNQSTSKVAKLLEKEL